MSQKTSLIKITSSLILGLVFSIFFIAQNVSASTGYIDTSVTNQAKVCHDAACTTPTPGIINFELSVEPSIVIDSVTGISGRVWGNELGWITMNPAGAGVRFADPDSGLLTGKAWSQVSGWVNFAVTGQSVTIDPSTGEFFGWAWTGGPYGGWIKFDCASSSTCVKTTWRAETGGGVSGGTTGTGTGGTTPPSSTSKDICSNLDGVQETIPSGYTVNDAGQCIKIIDECPNLPGSQNTLPKGYEINNIGACVTRSPSEDSCRNIDGVQKEIPEDYTVNERGDCVKPAAEDLCANLLDIQVSAPQGFYEQSGNCFSLPKSPDTIPPTQTGGDNGASGVNQGGNGMNSFVPSFLSNFINHTITSIQNIISSINNFIEQHITWPIFLIWILLLLLVLYLLKRFLFKI
ncbi:MAG: hypothetical protein ABIS26_02255 [Candidatus Paceibacterota bacterium]